MYASTLKSGGIYTAPLVKLELQSIKVRGPLGAISMKATQMAFERRSHRGGFVGVVANERCFMFASIDGAFYKTMANFIFE